MIASSSSSGSGSGSGSTAVAPADTPGLYRSDLSLFYLRGSNTSGYADAAFTFGTPGSTSLVPLAGDWSGSGVMTVGLYDEATSTFYLKDANGSGSASTVFTFDPAGGSGTLIPLAGDWTGSGVTTVGLYDPATSTFYLKYSNASGGADVAFAYGPAGGGWLPIVGDWNGNGQTTIGLYNPTTSVFYLRQSNTTGYSNVAFAYGPAGAGWLPIAGTGMATGRRRSACTTLPRPFSTFATRTTPATPTSHSRMVRPAPAGIPSSVTGD